MENNKYVDTRNTRGNYQDAVYQSIIDAGEDPFKKENLLKYHKGEGGILTENLSWFVINNQWRYKRSKYHFVIILQRYAEHLTELTAAELLDLRSMVSWIQQNYLAPGGALIIRSGDTLCTGASVKHLHAHYVVADVDDPDYGPENRVNVVIGGNKTKPGNPEHESNN